MSLMNAIPLELRIDGADDDTSRFLLTNWDPAYKADLVRHANDAEVAKFMSGRFPHPYTEANADWYLNYATTTTSERLMAIVREDMATGTREAIGSVGVMLQSGDLEHSGEVGYWLGRAFWGRGLATAVLRTFLEGWVEPYRRTHAPVPLSKLYATVYTPNRGSARVLEKNGFMIEGTLRRHIVKNGVYFDAYILGRVYSD
ncbi:hypothetical protein ACHHYP_07574 [Achlya hypogyna]|uniref:N-acetyltransferase domain-containing protein n=1 Tax=Achlya hypogyna TaxID=1202772 RepID=A0A1V9YQS5_ACHHY|nr:hypothetical protein ACHHYP_07574 [Achlya hypogyna]